MRTTATAGYRLESSFARELPELGTPWQAAPAPAPRLLLLNEELAGELGLDPEHLRSEEGVELLLGRNLPEDAQPVAQVYAGHQFGVRVPRLGDGRALLLGELRDSAGTLQDLHLKGSGPTPFARGGDGLAAVGPMLREFVISESLHALGIPTTRSLAVVATGRPVRRETMLPGAVLARVAASHLRVGTFEYARSTGDLDLLRRLADYAIDRHHPGARDAANPYLALYEAVVAAQAELVASWMLVGFVHGVMNTDNTTISGQSIDYGPCAFMEEFDPDTVFSSIDHQGRYAYGNQPAVAQWNLARLAEALLPLVAQDPNDAVDLLTPVLAAFPERYSAQWTAGMRAKLGLGPQVADDVATPLIQDVIEVLSGRDHTTFFWQLTEAARGTDEAVREQCGPAGSPGAEWLSRWQAAEPDPAIMAGVNPLYIPRNHLLEEALAAATDGDLEPVERLLELVTAPYTEQPGAERYTHPAPAGAPPFVTYCGT